MRSLRILRAMEVFSSLASQLRSSSRTAVCAVGRLLRLSHQKCKRCLAAIDGRLWILAAACGGGRSIVITEKMNRSVRADSWRGRAGQLLSTPTPTQKSSSDVSGFRVRLKFHGDLPFFLKSKASNKVIERNLGEKTSVKDVIESCGVPHPEVDLILVNRRPVDFAHLIAKDADIDLYPVQSECQLFKEERLQVRSITRFVADGHLGTLARNLRLLGFDVAYDRQAPDRRLLSVMEREDRALLTRDRRLLMHAVVRHGYCPRSQNADDQTIEVIRRFALFDSIAPFTRCLRCNAPLHRVVKGDVIEKLEPLTKIYYEEFHRCSGCGQIYWAGSHFSKLERRLEKIRAGCS
jgi:uncharacterized protein